MRNVCISLKKTISQQTLSVKIYLSFITIIINDTQHETFIDQASRTRKRTKRQRQRQFDKLSRTWQKIQSIKEQNKTKIQCEQETIIEIDTAQYKMVNQNKENMKDVKG